MAEQEQAYGSEREGDIVFDCPECGKSLAIDPQGEGLVITCPDCRTEVRVPDSEETEEIGENIDSEAAEMLDAARREIEALNRELAEANNRRMVLEHIRSGNIRRMEKVSDELAVIQSSLDRITSIFQDAATDDSSAAATDS